MDLGYLTILEIPHSCSEADASYNVAEYTLRGEGWQEENGDNSAQLARQYWLNRSRVVISVNGGSMGYFLVLSVM
jgi:hypothetical protein